MAIIRNFGSVLGVLLTFAVLFHEPVLVAGQNNYPVVGVFSFGDSYYDVGNKKYFTDASLPQYMWPYGKSTDDPNGRFSDGRVVPDFLAEFAKIPISIPPAMNPDGNFSRGANFAVADASILGSPVESMTLNQQLNKFRKMGSTWTDEFLAKSLFIFYIGTEDYLNFTKNNPNADASAQQAFVTSVVAKLKQDLSLFYINGARKFAFQTLAPLGCFPEVRQEYKTKDKCYEQLNDLAKQHNEKLGPMLDSLAKANTAFQYTVFDFYTALLRRIENPTTFRYSKTTRACCGIGSHDAFGCGQSIVHSNLCSYQRSFLFFDGRHNSEKTNEAIAHLFFAADPNVVRPMNIRELVVYPPTMSMLEDWNSKSSSVRDADSSSSDVASY